MTTYVVAGVLAVDDQDVSPGVIGFLVVAALGVATWLLIRSMNRQIRKIDLPDDPDDTRDASGTDSDLPDGPEPDGRGISPR
ncbi:MAG TPA: hypothetical protein VFR56_11880 [Actinomycetes bacterium]|nr:hypothetical protein [Actinomycetes bacterium]